MYCKVTELNLTSSVSRRLGHFVKLIMNIEKQTEKQTSIYSISKILFLSEMYKLTRFISIYEWRSGKLEFNSKTANTELRQTV